MKTAVRDSKTHRQAISHFKQVDPVIHKILINIDLDKYDHSHLNPDDYFTKLCQEIISQQLAGKAADAIIARFKTLVNDNITPQNIIDLDPQQLRDAGLSWAKVKYVRSLAQHTQDKLIGYKNLHTMTDSQVADQLIQVKGIGQWTVDMFLIFTLGRIDVFSYGDLGLKNALKKLYSISDKPSRAEIDAIITSWSPYKSYGSLALWHSLDNR